MVPADIKSWSQTFSHILKWDLAPVPLNIFHSMKIQNALVSNILDRSQRYFAHVTTVTLSWRVQNILVIGRLYFTLECFEFSSNFKFGRNMFSGTGARSSLYEQMSWHHSVLGHQQAQWWYLWILTYYENLNRIFQWLLQILQSSWCH